MILNISHLNHIGTIEYFPETQSIEVDFPLTRVTEDIHKFFGRDYVFNVPQSEKLDDYKEVTASPLLNELYFQYASGTLNSIGVTVVW